LQITGRRWRGRFRILKNDSLKRRRLGGDQFNKIQELRSKYIWRVPDGKHRPAYREEAVKACEKALKLAPEGMMIHVWATTVFSECGREKEARKTAKGLLRINPKFSVEAYTKKIPQNQKDKDRIAEALRKAGL
jgi:tetratricopeptide (TPR) repeat protein